MNKAIVIGSGFGGLAAALRMRKMGFDTTIVEKRDKPGGRAYVIEEEGFTFDCGPTIITAPYLIDDLFKLFGKNRMDYIDIVPVNPYYRIYFNPNSWFDYTGDMDSQIREIEKYSKEDAKNYPRFVKDTKAIMERGYLDLGDHPFESIWEMIKIAPDLFKLDVIKNMYQFASKYFSNENIRRVFSFHSLLIGGNPFNVSAIYALIPALEREWGVHFAMGGTGAIVKALVKLFEEEGGKILYNSEVTNISVQEGLASGVSLKGGTKLNGDIIISNGDYGHTYKELIDPTHRKNNSNKKVDRMHYSMSAVILFFGFKKDDSLNLQHHNIILSKRYKELLEDIFQRKVISEDFSQYLHIPTITDPALAPAGHHAAYTLIPVPNLSGNIDWASEGEPFAQQVFDFLDGDYIPNLHKNMVYKKVFTPQDFKIELNSYLGTGWGVEPRLTQSAYFRPNNQSEDIPNLFLVGANTHPGAGVPGVLSTAKVTENLIKKYLSYSQITGTAV